MRWTLHKTTFAVALWLIHQQLSARTTITATALAPPMRSDWESVSAYRKRLNITTFKYQPEHLSAHHCKYLAEKECQRQDEAIRDALKSPRRQLVAAPNMGESITVLVVLCRFSDHKDRLVPSRDHFDKLFNGGVESDGSDPNKVGSVKKWLYYSSMGKYKVTFDVQDWFTLDKPEAYYAAGVSALHGSGQVQELFKPVLDSLYQSGTVDFAKLDTTGWGTLDHFVAIHSGYGAELGNPSDGCDLNKEQDRIWSQGTLLTTDGWQSPDFAYTVSHYVLAGAFDPGFCEGKPANMAIFTHEYMHGFGLIDLYDQDIDEAPINVGGTGNLCIMSGLFGWTRDLAFPGHLSPFSRAKVGWIDPFEITMDGTYPVQASEISSQVYVIKQNFPDGEYLYIENRQPVKWDQNWPAGGIVIYHVDELAPKQTARGYPGHPNWPTDHYQVAVLQADGAYEIEKGISPGNEGDFWTKGMTLKSGGDSWPNTDSYQGGRRRATGIEITVTSNSQFIMSFTVSGLSASPALRFPTEDTATGILGEGSDPDTTGGTITWILTVLGGVAAMIGVLIVVL